MGLKIELPQAKIEHIGEIVQVKENFSKLEFVATTIDEYPDTFKFEIHRGKQEFIEQFDIGDIVSIKANLRGRIWRQKQDDGSIKVWYFVTLVAWAVRMAGEEAQQQQSAIDNDMPTTTAEEPEEDLPF